MKNDIVAFKNYLLAEEKRLLKQPSMERHFMSNKICEVADPLLEDYKYALSHAISNWNFHMISSVLEYLFEKHGIKTEYPSIELEVENWWYLGIIIEDKTGKRIGFYKNRPLKEHASRDADRYHLNESYVLCWVKELSSRKKQLNKKTSSEYSDDGLAQIKTLAAKELFERYFSLNEYYVYLDAARRSSIKVREQIGYRVSRNLKTSYLSEFTLMLCFMVIGGIKRELLNDASYFESVSRRKRFDELARIIKKKGQRDSCFFYAKFREDTIQKIMLWEFSPEDEYDNLGFMKLALRFKKVDEFFEGDMYADEESEIKWLMYSDDISDNDDVVIDPDHLPDKMWVKPMFSQEMELIFSQG